MKIHLFSLCHYLRSSLLFFYARRRNCIQFNYIQTGMKCIYSFIVFEISCGHIFLPAPSFCAPIGCFTALYRLKSIDLNVIYSRLYYSRVVALWNINGSLSVSKYSFPFDQALRTLLMDDDSAHIDVKMTSVQNDQLIS